MKRMLLLPLLATVAPSLAFAGGEGNYARVGAGVNVANDVDLKFPAARSEVEFDVGPSFVGALGHSYGNGIRTELELSHRMNDVDSVTGATTASGDVRATGLSANVLYDVMKDSRFSPYVGVGVGGMYLRAHEVSSVGGTRVNDEDIVPFVQGTVGVSYAINDPWGVFAQYQYATAVQRPEFVAENNGRVKGEYQSNSVTVGVRYSFNAPTPVVAAPPPPPPAPMAAPVEGPKSRTYMVFFDFDKSDITPEAKRILENAVASMHEGNSVRVELTGHADRSGSDPYNMKLSERRAERTKKALIAMGVPGAEIHTSAKGEREPLVPTEDGVKEPQNRRVEIVYTIGR